MISKSQISYIKSLHLKKYRKEHQQFIIEGDKLTDEFLNSDFQVKEIYLLDSKREKYELLLSKSAKKIEIITVRREEIEKMSQLSTAPDVMALVDIPMQTSEDTIPASEFENNIVLMLDDVKDPGNLGTIIRIADWFGIKHVICSENCVELYNSKVIQSTMGSILRINVYYTDLINYMKHNGNHNVYGALLEGNSIYEHIGKLNGILLMGSESHGISMDLIPFISHPISIPRFGMAESLNVAIATGILCSEIKRR